MMGYYHNGAWNGGDWLAMVLMMVAFWGIIVGLVVWAVRSTRPRGHECHHRNEPAPEGILAERFARGEIDDDEYRRRHDVLVGSGAPGASGRT